MGMFDPDDRPDYYFAYEEARKEVEKLRGLVHEAFTGVYEEIP